MPKAARSGQTGVISGPLDGSGSQNPNVLKRNQACHQCRRRKLKCDAQRPCSTCRRSHSHAKSHAAAGATVPEHPDCTFDDLLPENASQISVETPPLKTRYEKLENRINELEGLLGQKGLSDLRPPQSQSPFGAASLSSSHPGFSPFDLGLSPGMGVQENINFGQFNRGSSSDQSSSPPGSALIWPNWPKDVPSPELLRHLVDVFFLFHPHSTRLFHAQSFKVSLTLPPAHPKFPAAPVLHAICAIGSLYTSLVSSPPLPNLSEVDPHEIFTLKRRLLEERPDSFAGEQAKLAKETCDALEFLGDHLFEILQARIILSWFAWSHGKWAELFVSSGHSMRICVPLGLNICPPFHSITKSLRPTSIIQPARDPIEDETRRNAFWLAYAVERQHGHGNGWCSAVDDQDISQLLPVRMDQFDNGNLVKAEERQWAHTSDLLLAHPLGQTDSFILYIKGTILLSRVKSFNLRFRSRHYAGDPLVGAQEDTRFSLDPADPRSSPLFIELDSQVSTFRGSFPTQFRNPIVGNLVDSHLYTTCLMPQAAVITLHDPHANVRRSGCISALKILTAARTILDLAYGLWSTSYDITLLDSFCIYCFFSAGRVLVRFLQSSIEAESQEQINTLRSELDFIQAAIAKLGERMPLAYRYSTMLEQLTRSRCGPPATSQPEESSMFSRPDVQPIGEQIIHEAAAAIASNPGGTSGEILVLGMPSM